MAQIQRAAFLVAATLVALSVAAAAPAPAEAATTSSAVTVTAAAFDTDAAHAPFPNLAVTVSQTQNLQAQGIRVSWTGGKKSTAPSAQTGGENFLQIMQCWGADPSDATRPDRTTCQYGGLLTPGARRDGLREAGSVAAQDDQYTAPGTSVFDPTYTSIPFRSATGPTVASVVNNAKVNVNVNSNQFFTQLTTNEISWVGSASDGTGAVQFEVQTAAQSPGLGCGTATSSSSGAVTGSPCWLVIVPRGTSDNGASSITSSGLFWDSWKHSLAVKLDFKPLGLRCSIGAAERQLAGSELLAGAVASWQPTLCAATGGAVYSMIAGSESDAATASNTTATAPLALTSRPLTGAADGLQYAPVGLSAVSISFSVDRSPAPDAAADIRAQARLPFESMNLTPRLVAKLLTNSYLDSLPYFSDRSHLTNGGQKNPRNIVFDPDFLQVNPDWAAQAIVSPAVADVLLPQGRSDAAWALWSYVLADPDAAAFLEGTPDPWGMVVNPWSSTVATKNRSGTALQLPRDNFPKADPVEQAADVAPGPGAINLVTWRPYVSDLETSAYYTLRGDGQVLGGWDPNSTPPKYGKNPRNLPGSQAVLALTDSASAERYQVRSAALKNQAGQFVAPTTAAMSAAAAAMTPTIEQSQVLSYDPTSTAARTAAAAYPLTLPIYAATNPSRLDSSLRASYSAFVKYAATDGQVPGEALGQLPAGYASIPDAWRVQALAVAQSIATGQATLPTKSTSASSSSTPAAATSQAPSSVPPVSAAPGDPTPTGTLAPSLSSSTTPEDPSLGGLPAALPGTVIGVIAALAIMRVVSRRRRVL